MPRGQRAGHRTCRATVLLLRLGRPIAEMTRTPVEDFFKAFNVRALSDFREDVGQWLDDRSAGWELLRISAV
jgi:hypothetical protein